MGNSANRDLDHDRDEPAFLDNINRLSGGKMERLPHSDTVKYVMEKLDPMELAGVRDRMLRRLIRNKVLYSMRPSKEVTGKKHFPVAIDAVHFHTSHRKIPHSTRRVHTDGTVDYMLIALEAQIVNRDGRRIPLMTEFIENEQNPDYVKQDCELKACKRLLPRLKETYPRLPLVILLDGLYLCEDIVNLVRKNGWELSVTVTDKTSAFLAKAEEKMAANPRNRIEDTDPVDERRRTVTWANGVKHVFGDTEVCLNVLKMNKTNDQGETETLFYATTIFLSKRRVIGVLDQVCRTRWQIEESFKVQKCHGLGLEEAFGTVENAGLNFYHLVQIANIIMQLILHSSLFRRLQQHQNPDRIRHPIRRPMLEWYGTIKNILAKIKSCLLMVPLSGIDISNWRLEFNTS